MDIQRIGLLISVALGSILWGLIELMALQRAQWLRWRLRL